METQTECKTGIVGICVGRWGLNSGDVLVDVSSSDRRKLVLHDHCRIPIRSGYFSTLMGCDCWMLINLYCLGPALGGVSRLSRGKKRHSVPVLAVLWPIIRQAGWMNVWTLEERLGTKTHKFIKQMRGKWSDSDRHDFLQHLGDPTEDHRLRSESDIHVQMEP